MIVAPLVPTWSRWQRLCASPYSLLRSLQYERLASIRLQGRSLDLGGGSRVTYRRLLHCDRPVVSVNIDPAARPTIIADGNHPLPIADGAFDNVVSLNTFEHLRRDESALTEMVRILRPGGTFHVFVPFLFRVHAYPFDYSRRTAFWWDEALLELGVAPEALRVEPLVWDQVSSSFAQIEFAFGPLHRPLRALVLAQALLRHRPTYADRLAPVDVQRGPPAYALAYYIHGRR